MKNGALASKEQRPVHDISKVQKPLFCSKGLNELATWKTSVFLLVSVAEQTGLSVTWSQTQTQARCY